MDIIDHEGEFGLFQKLFRDFFSESPVLNDTMGVRLVELSQLRERLQFFSVGWIGIAIGNIKILNSFFNYSYSSIQKDRNLDN